MRHVVIVILPAVLIVLLLGIRFTAFRHLDPLSFGWWSWIIALIVMSMGFGSGLQSTYGRRR